MRVLFCGDRNWTDAQTIKAAFDRYPVTVCIEGEARGADRMAASEARERGIAVAPYPADWETDGRAAGPIRNRQMLTDGKPELVLAFHADIENSKGTRDMVMQARKAGIPVRIITKESDI